MGYNCYLSNVENKMTLGKNRIFLNSFDGSIIPLRSIDFEYIPNHRENTVRVYQFGKLTLRRNFQTAYYVRWECDQMKLNMQIM